MRPLSRAARGSFVRQKTVSHGSLLFSETTLCSWGAHKPCFLLGCSRSSKGHPVQWFRHIGEGNIAHALKAHWHRTFYWNRSRGVRGGGGRSITINWCQHLQDAKYFLWREASEHRLERSPVRVTKTKQKTLALHIYGTSARCRRRIVR